ncbi:cation efflux protein [Backusella circina FSU 941]|nr:cation efflux protein [Backusella circina FSU 941]
MVCDHTDTNEYTPLIKTYSHIHSFQNSCSNLVSNKLSDSSSRSTKKKLLTATTIALVFFATELVAGYFANSLALMSDAFHLLSDVASFVVAIVAVYLAEKPPTKTHTYGYHRAEVISAFVSVLTIWVLTGFLVMEAIDRIKSPQVIDARLMCITAAIGVFVNIVLAFVLGGHHHGHSHSHDEEHNHHHHEEGNINLRAAALHVLGDLLASIGVLVSSIVLIFKPEYTIVDPICTFVFSIIVLYTTYHLVKDSLSVLMEGAPNHIKPDEIENSLLEIPGVIAVHDLHIWTLSPGKSSLTVHVNVDPSTSISYDEILSRGQQIICSIYGVHHSTLQIESDKAEFTHHCKPDICTPK